MFHKAALFDTSIATKNLGDEIIVDHCKKIVYNHFSRHHFFVFPTHDFLGSKSVSMIGETDFQLVCGTNILTGSMFPFVQKTNPWYIRLFQLFFGFNAILFGSGWAYYQGKPTMFSSFFYNRLLSQNYLHSVRDQHTKDQLSLIGIDNVLNTGCPTMWGLTPDFCRDIDTTKSNRAVFTLTYYRPDIVQDTLLLQFLLQHYEEVFFWPQQYKDLDYLMTLSGGDKISVVGPSLQAYDDLLGRGDIDYIGSRLHGGIRALNHKVNALILAIDNRATEIHKDTGLPVVQRSDLTEGLLESYLVDTSPVSIALPQDSIDEWLGQFDVKTA